MQDVEIRIPGQDEKPFAPKFAAPQVEKAVETPAVSPVAKLAASEPKPAPEVVAKPSARVVEVEREKPVEKPVAKNDDAKRAAAILSGHGAEAQPAAKSGEFLVLIGAFANEANVKTLKAKLGEQGIKTISEPLDTPQGKKTRLRAGPFASRDAADKALEKMRKIGVSGVVAAKQ